MFDSALAFERYRLEVVRSWPASEAKDRLIAAIEYSLEKAREGRASSGAQKAVSGPKGEMYGRSDF
jgi:hypothetical protein